MTKKKAKKPAKKPVVNNSKPRRKVSGERRRVNLKLDEDLAEFAFTYAERNGTTVTQLITDHFVELRRKEDERLGKDAEQI